MVLVVAFASCKKIPEVNLKYVDVERDLITVGMTTATVQCDYQYIATLKKAYLYYGEDTEEADMNTAEMRVVQNTLYVDLAGLKSNTTYSYFYEFHNGFNSMRTVVKTFKTETSPIVVTLPTVITAEVTEIAENSAQCGGEVTNDGGAEVTERGICWSTNVNPTLSDNHIAAGSGLGEFTAMMDGLQDNTIYHVRAYANNEAGTAYGLDREFTTASIVVLPTVITGEISEITTNSAICGGEITNDGGAEVTERGICWGTNENPTLNDSHLVTGMGTGAFTAMMNELEANTTYHVRAYATNEMGTAYGLDKEFFTLSGGSSGIHEGAISGLFTINENGDQVYFSQGNLQYQASTNTWRFAENQWDYVGDSENGTVFENGIKCNNALISSIYDGWIDLFGWGTSGYNHGAVCYQPWSISTDDHDYKAYGENYCNLNSFTGQADWGYNAIVNGGNQEHIGWRTPTRDEWGYIFNIRPDAAFKYGHGQVNGVNGMIILPDEWTLPDGLSFLSGNSDWANVYSGEQWNQMETNGAVFLPAAGGRNGTLFGSVGSFGPYWSSTCLSRMYFNSDLIYPQYEAWDRYYGCSVRLLIQSATP